MKGKDGRMMTVDELRLRTQRDGRLLSEQEAIDYLGLHTRPNPQGSLRWLMRVHRLAYVKLAKGINGFKRADLDEFIAASRVAAGVRGR